MEQAAYMRLGWMESPVVSKFDFGALRVSGASIGKKRGAANRLSSLPAAPEHCAMR